MRFVVSTALLAALAVGAPTAPRTVPVSHTLHEKRHGHNEARWQKRGRISSDVLLPMRIGLKQSNLHKGYDMLMDVSHPSSSNYGKHYTAEEVIEIFQPEATTVESVREWLIEHGIAPQRIHHSDNKGWLAMDLTTAEAESLLHAEYHEYEHTESGMTTASCEEYHVPKHIQEHIDYVTPGVKLAAPKRRSGSNAALTKRARGMDAGQPIPPPKIRYDVRKTNPNDTSTCDQAITPACIRALYDVPLNHHAAPGNALGIFEEGDYYAQEDLDLFFANFTPGIPEGTHPTPAFIDGASAPVPVSQAGGESDLDFELAYPLVWPQNITLFQTDDYNYATDSNGKNASGFLNTFLDAIDGSYCTYSAYGETGDDPALDPVYPDDAPGGYKGNLQCGVYKPTNVISVSYGLQEDDLPEYYQERQCSEFLKLGLQGVSVLFASGDDGVAGPPGDASPNGCLNNGTVFSPAFPNSCPYITNVGATKVYPGHTVYEPESAVNDPIGHPYAIAYSSGGGFSNIYSIPEYQKDAVAEYFRYHDPGYKYYSALHNATANSSTPIGANGGVYNRIGRGYPDVAANGDNIAVYNQGKYGLSGGTSASTPIFSSIINRINEERLLAGKKSIGFLNPALYSNPYMLNDITNGSNPGCNTNGFSAVRGWDPVTGLGTPNYPKMLAYFLNLP